MHGWTRLLARHVVAWARVRPVQRLASFASSPLVAASRSPRLSSAVGPVRALRTASPVAAAAVVAKPKSKGKAPQKKEKPKVRAQAERDQACIAHISATMNNTIISITLPNGDLLAGASGGSVGFKGAKRKSPFASQTAAQAAGERAMANNNVKSVFVMIRGFGPGRVNAVRGLTMAGLDVQGISDVTKLPHNGCRRPRQRRI